MSKTKVGACYREDCININREESTCNLPEITIGIHPQSRKETCMQFALDFEYALGGRTGLKRGGNGGQ